VPERFKLPTVDEAIKRAMKVDYQAIMAEKESTIKKFTDIMQK
jgi:iron(III) transport system substrate-binding protein